MTSLTRQRDSLRTSSRIIETCKSSSHRMESRTLSQGHSPICQFQINTLTSSLDTMGQQLNSFTRNQVLTCSSQKTLTQVMRECSSSQGLTIKLKSASKTYLK
jgi:hypothetical protein